MLVEAHGINADIPEADAEKYGEVIREAFGRIRPLLDAVKPAFMERKEAEGIIDAARGKVHAVTDPIVVEASDLYALSRKAAEGVAAAYVAEGGSESTWRGRCAKWADYALSVTDPDAFERKVAERKVRADRRKAIQKEVADRMKAKQDKAEADGPMFKTPLDASRFALAAAEALADALADLHGEAFDVASEAYKTLGAALKLAKGSKVKAPAAKAS